MNFMRKHGILQNCVACPGPLLAGGHQGGCGKEMQLKVTNDSKVLEFVYLWSQGFTHSEVMHKLKLSKKTY